MDAKIFQIADSIHGSVQLSQMEKLIISTQAFNRLHSVLQNSTAYLTYPANRTSRFAHSIGAMHLCGRILRHSVENSVADTRDDFLGQVEKRIRSYLDDGSEARAKIWRTRLGDHIAELMADPSVVADCDRLYVTNCPSLKQEQLWVYVILFQAVRCSALLHDIGHPPFSHVSELALTRIKDETSRANATTKRYEAFRKSLGSIGKGELHEDLGNRIADRLLEHVGRKVQLNAQPTYEEARCQLLYGLVHYLCIDILRETGRDEGNFLCSDIHGIVSGPMDGDRLDYVVRDLENSGFMKSRADYERLLSSMRLMRVDGRFYFCPDIRALSLVEDFFKLRWYLYKYVVYHHRVRKTDALLTRTVTHLATRYIMDGGAVSKEKGYALPTDISGLWGAVAYGAHDGDKMYFDALVQWDDSWMLTVLRRHYYEEYRDRKDELALQLEELLSNQKRYSSLIKRMNDFREIDQACVQSMTTPEELLPEDLRSPFEQARNKKTGGFFLVAVKAIIEFEEKNRFQEIVQHAVDTVQKELRIENTLIQFNKNKASIKEDTYVHCQGEPVPLSELSSIMAELDKNWSLFPVFFLYLTGEHKSLPLIRRRIGEELGKGLSKHFTAGYNIGKGGE